MNYGLLISSLTSASVENTGFKVQNKGQQKSFENLFKAERDRPEISSKSERRNEHAERTNHTRREVLEGSERNKDIRKNVTENSKNEDIKRDDDADIRKEDAVRNKEVKSERKEKGTKETEGTSTNQGERQEQDKELKEKLKDVLEKLGITVEDLDYLLKLHGASPNGSVNFKLDELINKISGLVGQGIENKDQLLGQIKDILEEIGAKATIKVGHIKQIENQVSDEVQNIPEGSQPEQSGSSNQKIENSLKEQNNRVGGTDNKQAEESKQKNEIIRDVEQSNRRFGNKVQDESTKKPHTTEISKTLSQEKAVREGIKENKEAKGEQEQNGQEWGAEEQQSESWTDKVKVINIKADKMDSNFKTTQENVPQALQNANEVKEIRMETKANNVVHTNRDEILKQIVDKASVVLSKDKAEMIVDLKPDHLGKLSLKVVTERGIMTAQIMAENQQVKQIIESNFNVLRDALEKQGITVQQFSVSVGQDSWNKNFGQEAQRNFTKSYNKNQGITGIAVSNFGYQGGEQSKQAYMWPDSTVNYTA